MKILRSLNGLVSGELREFCRNTARKLGLLSWLRRQMRANTVSASDSTLVGDKLGARGEYAARLRAEQSTFEAQVNVHDLPAIYHYWSNKFLLPKLKAFGFSCPNSFYVMHLLKQLHTPNGPSRFVSIGAGNCDTEVEVARMLRSAGATNFTIECLDINEDMLNRGRALATKQGLSEHFLFAGLDLNCWRPKGHYDAVIANQSLHHILELEKLFASIRDSMKPGGIFLTSDMIGRNGHQRWPEALEIVNEFWPELPESYRYNLQLRRHEATYLDWDCAQEGFEGIRAQDVLPLLAKNFYFEDFFVFANAIDPFIDRGFGHHFSPDREWDKAFIDRVHMADETAMTSGRVKPTHILAAMRLTPFEAMRYIPPFTPEFSIRKNQP